ncbi:MAG: hypothetical protein KF861_04595 [Planctomycetaceae bacterium]|nr:hypothetical protein [Planctomycetaceae bacterium]
MAKKKSASVARQVRAQRPPKKAVRGAKTAGAAKARSNKNADARKRSTPAASAQGKSKSSATKKPAVRKNSRTKQSGALGRPKVPGTAELDQMFLKDFEARQVFTFLGVKTLKELETHRPDEIVERLTGPMVQTVQRIRKALAVNHRFLAGDELFAVEFCKQIR